MRSDPDARFGGERGAGSAAEAREGTGMRTGRISRKERSQRSPAGSVVERISGLIEDCHLLGGKDAAEGLAAFEPAGAFGLADCGGPLRGIEDGQAGFARRDV